MSFFKDIFDKKFEHFITIRIIGFLMMFSYVIVTIAWILSLLLFLKKGFGYFLLDLIVGGIVWLFVLIYIRVMSELSVALIKIAQNSSDIKNILERKE